MRFRISLSVRLSVYAGKIKKIGNFFFGFFRIFFGIRTNRGLCELHCRCIDYILLDKATIQFYIGSIWSILGSYRLQIIVCQIKQVTCVSETHFPSCLFGSISRKCSYSTDIINTVLNRIQTLIQFRLGCRFLTKFVLVR